MAYGLNFYSEWADNEENVYRTEILKRDYAGSATEVTSGGTPFVWSLMDDASSDVFRPVRTQKAEIEWVSDDESGFDISDIFITDEQEYKVRFGSIDSDTEVFTILWEGFLTFTDCKEPFQPKPYTVQMSARCGLSLLRDQYFLDANGRFVENHTSLLSALVKSLSRTELNLEIDVSIGLMEEGGDTPKMLSDTYINADGLRGKTAYEVLEGVLNSVNGFISQTYGAWTIRGVAELQSDFITVNRYSSTGSLIGEGVVLQSRTIGSQELADDNPGYRNMQPMSDVMESLAEPFSVITNTVSPGIPVNLLKNGTFSPYNQEWGVNLGAMTGWANSPEPKGWRIEGDGKPDDPYRFVMIGSVQTTGDVVYGSRTKNGQKQTFIYNPSYITVYRDGGKDSYPNIKVVVSGAFKGRDGTRVFIACRMNDGDKDNVQWMDETGKWTRAKKALDRKNIKIDIDTPHNPEEYKQIEDMPLQTFEFKSDKLNDYLNRPGGWVAHLYFSIYPATIGADGFPEISNDFSPALSLEDISVSLTTETAFEQEHDYEIDAKKVISNGDSYKYTTIVADKINILTAHQKRPLHRVMTGYATVGVTRLSKAWRRVVNGVPIGVAEPLQHLTLRERLRLLCGKRRVLEGSFYGGVMSPTDSIINLFDGGTDNFYTVTGWSWDVKNRIHQLRLHELDFSPLPDEVITQTDRKDNGRGNRLYTGGGGSTSSGSGSNGGAEQEDQILLDDPEPYEYEVLIEDEEDRVCDIVSLIQSSHAADLLEAKILTFPDWISEISLYRGEDLPEEDLPDEGILQVLWKGKPVKSGTYQILVELSATDGADYILSIPLVVEPSEDFIESWPPVFIDLPPLIFEKGILSTQGHNIFEYLDPEGDHTGVGLSPKLLNKPGWVSESSIVFGGLAVTGKSTTLGDDYLTYQLSDAIGRTTFLTFIVRTIAPIEFTHEIPGLGEIPGSYELPETFQVVTTTDAPYDTWEASLIGGGDLGLDVNETWADSDPLPTFISHAGQFTYSITLYRGEVAVKSDTVKFVLYDEAYLAKLKAFLTVAETSVGEISLDGTTIFDAQPVWNVRFDIEDIEHDEVVLTMGEHVRTYDLEESALVGSYSLFESDEEKEAGVYSTTVEVKLLGVTVQERVYTFEIGTPEPKPEAGFELISYKPGTANYTIVGDLPLSGGFVEIPDAYGVLFQPDIEIDSFEWEMYKLEDGAFAPLQLSVQKITGNTEKILIFDGKKSTQITGAHDPNARFRIDGIARDASGKILQLVKADWTFREKLAPEDYSGLEFWKETDVTFISTQIDSNVPKLGASYALPFPDFWTLSFTGFKDGTVYDRGVVKLWKNGVQLELEDGYVKDISFPPTTSTTSGRLCVMGLPDALNDRKRYLFTVAGRVKTYIDEPGEYKVIVEVYSEGVLIASPEATITLTEPAPEPEIKDCCCDGSEGGDYDPWEEKQW